ncbi:2-oxoisovalerate dehydrogenase subunit alpha, mitochondrial-like [Condylostylus longicornis]|uniref:2-oxoisovalerate dehydrogenase subunit alpha, mitochondrial-like n=1 Tax=Condylostylus longicornis TaxID=2530218 RepID=UPI00244E27D1|nr:2-oxoisovalerate dehydrogenase subunit alpha, mitochondrial-like [Condylostylus longicornis]
MTPLRPIVTRACSTFGKATAKRTEKLVASPAWRQSLTFSSQRTFSASAHQPKPDPTDVYHAGLRNTVFTNECEISSESQTIPIFRVLGYDGKLQAGWQPPFSAEECLERYRFMVRVNVWDMMLYNIQRQGRISFYMQNQGEEALQTAIGNALGKDDHLWCQYRELGVLLWRGLQNNAFTVTNVLDQLFSTAGDPGKGRQMPISYTNKETGLQTICTPLTTQVPHAAGCGYAFKLNGEKRAAVAFFGEGAASEGDFHAAMNFAAVLKSQTLFVCRNNGYAISTPVKDQYAGDGIAIRGLSYGMDTIRVDGNDFFASYIATKKAWELCVNESKPVCLEFMTYRLGHHSTSDDSAQYRPAQEMSMWTQPGIDAIARLRSFLENNGLWDEAKEEELRKEAKHSMLQEIKQVENRKSVAILPGIFDDVYDVEPWHIKEQREECRQHLKRNSQHYDMTKFQGIE